MPSIVGTYVHERDENLYEYFLAMGVRCDARMVHIDVPRLKITKEGDTWTIENNSEYSDFEINFVLDKEYEEITPSGEVYKVEYPKVQKIHNARYLGIDKTVRFFQNVTTAEGDNILITTTITNANHTFTRRYEFSDENMVLAITNEETGKVTKRYYKRLA